MWIYGSLLFSETGSSLCPYYNGQLSSFPSIDGCICSRHNLSLYTVCLRSLQSRFCHEQQGYDSYDTDRLELVFSKFAAGDDNLIEVMKDNASIAKQ